MRSLLFSALVFLQLAAAAQLSPAHDLVFDRLPQRWDEGIPLGNGWLGALMWQKGENLRLSLDRVDLWDDRPMPEIHRLKYQWVAEQVRKGAYDTVQKIGDEPYEKNPAPSKIPGAALEFQLQSAGTVKTVRLDLKQALGTIHFSNGLQFNCYVHANRQTGYFEWKNVPDDLINALKPELIIPAYNVQEGTGNNKNTGLQQLRYAKGTVTKTSNNIRYHQPTWKGHYYEVLVQWKPTGSTLTGAWTIASDQSAVLPSWNATAAELTGWTSHTQWWKHFWGRSSVSIPDTLLAKQYFRELYKFGSAARSNTPPISLQAIWTADNGSLPPWKGDYHHDLNTQLSYWPGFSGNQLSLTKGFTNWLWKVRAENKRWTKQYFGVDGLNVPGVTTISGKPMGGWIQYSLSPTTACWLSQYFYWQWKYSMDKTFLLQYAYPYVRDVATYLQNITKVVDGVRRLPISSSPEYNDNSLQAWFTSWTNYDLSLARYVCSIAAEMATAAGKNTEVTQWKKLLEQLPPLDVNASGLTVAPGTEQEHSHRHHSPYMAIYPLGLLRTEQPEDQLIIEKSLQHLAAKGTRAWCGYSFSWIANLYAHAHMADSAVQQLRIFATNFCSPNSFHVNGDQKGGQYSNFTYRPFTLEGNFAFAQGIHALLLQSRREYIEVFPAVPDSWKDVSFQTLRAEGAFLVSAVKENGVEIEVRVKAEQDGVLKLKRPKHFHTWITRGVDRNIVQLTGNNIFVVPMKKGQTIIFQNGFE